MAQERAPIGEMGHRAEEGELAAVVQGAQPGQDQAPEQGTEDAHRQQECGARGDPARAIARDTSAGYDHMDMGMMGQRRAPAVQDGGDADMGAQMLWIGGDGQHRLRCRLEQQIIDRRLVLEGDGGDLGRQREHAMEIADRQQVGLARFEPDARGGALARGAVPVAAAVIGDPPVAAVGAGLDMTAHCGRTALFDRRYDLELVQA